LLKYDPGAVSRLSATADVFRAVADANRRALLDRLAAGEAPVGALVDHAGLSYSAVSQHLAVLLAAGLVRRRQDGRRRLYRVDAAPLREVHDWIRSYETFWPTKLAQLRQVLDEEAGS
jgi:DNA-binding transcriptional ArsR family regulator